MLENLEGSEYIDEILIVLSEIIDEQYNYEKNNSFTLTHYHIFDVIKNNQQYFSKYIDITLYIEIAYNLYLRYDYYRHNIDDDYYYEYNEETRKYKINLNFFNYSTPKEFVYIYKNYIIDCININSKSNIYGIFSDFVIIKNSLKLVRRSYDNKIMKEVEEFINKEINSNN